MRAFHFTANTILSVEVTDVLRRSKITGNVLVLPEGQLNRGLYGAVNKALANAGGKWKRGTGHVFPSDPTAKLGLALETGVSVDEKKKFQAFYTPQGLAAHVVELAGVNGKTVLEPSAGEGALVKECFAQGCSGLFAVELNPEAREKLATVVGSWTGVVTSDFLKENPHDYDLYDRVVMNPPFTKGQDIKHVIHAYKFLKPGGRLVSIMSPGATQKRAFLAVFDGYQVERVPAGAFKESGTEIETIIVTIDKDQP